MSAVINGTNGITFPTWTTGTRPASPAQGQAGYNTTIGAMETYTGSTWSTSDLPAVGASGNVLTSNGTSWASATPPSTTGGATETTTGSNITLTSSSNRVQSITPTADITVTLPDATTLSKGTPTFTITNVSSVYNVYIATSDSAIIKIVTPGTAIVLSLIGNSTSAGTWQINYLPILATIGSTTQFDSNSVNNAWDYSNGYNTQYLHNIALSSTSVVTIYARSTGIYAVAATISGATITYGSPTLISSYVGNFGAVGLSSSNIIVWSAQSGVNPKAYGLTVSGTSITVSTASASIGSYGSYLVSISRLNDTDALVGYYADSGSSTYGFRVVTHAGASAPTLGTVSSTIAAANVYTTFVPVTSIPLTSTTTLIAYCGPSSGGYYLTARVVTTSGSSAPTLGTALTTTVVAGAATTNGAAVVPYSSTEVALILYGTSPIVSFTISGTTVTQQASVVTTATSLPVLSWGTSTTTLANDYGSLYKYTYTPVSGTFVRSSASVSPPSSYNYQRGGNCVALDSTKYYMTSYKDTTNAGYGQVITLL
jgi:hypothetical protein